MGESRQSKRIVPHSPICGPGSNGVDFFESGLTYLSVSSFCEKLVGCVQHMLGDAAAGKETNPGSAVVGCRLAGRSENQDRNLRQALMQFGDECWAANAGHMQAADHQA